jgi:hypothetical protein
MRRPEFAVGTSGFAPGRAPTNPRANKLPSSSSSHVSQCRARDARPGAPVTCRYRRGDLTNPLCS